MKDALEQYQALPNNLIYSEILFPFDYLLRTTKSARITVCNDDIFANHSQPLPHFIVVNDNFEHFQ